MKRAIIFLVVLAISLMGAPSYLIAQNKPSKQEALLKVSEKLGLPQSSKFYGNFSTKVSNNLSSDKKKKACIKAKQEFPALKGGGNLVKHFTGESGIPFSTEAPIPHPFMAALDYLNENKEEVIKTTAANIENARKEALAPALPICSDNKTLKARTSNEKPTDEEANSVLLDLIFMDPKDIPENPSLYFGESALVMPYVEGELNPMLPFIQGSAVKCLPYRLRVTPKFSYAHTGQDALKNYHSNPNGHGQLSDKYKNWPLIVN